MRPVDREFFAEPKAVVMRIDRGSTGSQTCAGPAGSRDRGPADRPRYDSRVTVDDQRARGPGAGRRRDPHPALPLGRLVKVVVTGAGGFLGWHTRLRLRARTDHVVVPVTRPDWPLLARAVEGADAVLHLAGVNRGPDDEVEAANAALASDLAEAVRAAGSSPRIVYANSIRDGEDTAYGRGKGAARDVLDRVADEVGGSFVDVRLPNIFGEHGRPGTTRSSPPSPMPSRRARPRRWRTARSSCSTPRTRRSTSWTP